MRVKDRFLEKWEKNLHVEWYGEEKDIDVDEYERYNRLIDYVPLKSKDILEIGAGSGYIVRQLKNKGKNIIGTTICDGDVAQYNLLWSDMHDLEWTDESFDVAIARHVLEHALSPRLVIREIWRVLRPSGMFLVETPITKDGIELNNRGHFYCLTPAGWENILERNGFEIVTKEYDDSSYRLICKKSAMKER
jgi:2-polyprenyl-3-methyl-5-hydroxy-6-metoxy-1,4-benzoquinol methylase